MIMEIGIPIHRPYATLYFSVSVSVVLVEQLTKSVQGYRTIWQRALGYRRHSTTALPRGNPPQESAWPYGSLDSCRRHLILTELRHGAALPDRVGDLHMVTHGV